MEYPQRIICLTEEGTEILYAIGQQHRLVGISGFTYRPKIARKEKPVVCTFLEANYEKIIELKPDLIIGYSDLQATIASDLIKRGMNVVIFNHRSINEILSMILQFTSMIGNVSEGKKLVQELQENINKTKEKTNRFKVKPKVYFEEWYDPLISSIEWVSELIEICGGELCFPDIKSESLAKNRILTSEQVIKANPDIIIGSWCGKKFKPEKVKQRDGWDEINAVKNDLLFEIKSTIILQPGPAVLTDGINEMAAIIEKAAVRGIDSR